VANTFLNNEENRRAIGAHDSELLTWTLKGGGPDPNGGDATFDFKKARELESANEYLHGCSGATFQDGQVTGQSLEQHIYGLHHAYTHNRARMMVSGASPLNVAQTDGHVYQINWTTDVIGVFDRNETGRRLQHENVDTKSAKVVMASKRAEKAMVRDTQKNIKLAPEIKDELVEIYADKMPDVISQVSEILGIGPGSI
jgi:hypothetical protein